MMDKYLTTRTAKHLLITGAVILLISYVLALISLWNVYGLAGDIDNLDTSRILLWRAISKLDALLSIAGYVLVGAALIIFLVVYIRNDRRRH